MHFTMTMDLDNAQFAKNPEYELARILERIGGRIEEGEVWGKIWDNSGNRIGTFEIDTED